MITHYENDSSTAAWRAEMEAMRSDDGDCVDFRAPAAKEAA